MPLPRGYKRKKLKNWRAYCAVGSIRTLLRGSTRIMICCPKGKWRKKAKRCAVGTRAFSIDKGWGPGFGFTKAALARGAKKEHREHPSFTKADARRIARDHLTENPSAYGFGAIRKRNRYDVDVQYTNSEGETKVYTYTVGPVETESKAIEKAIKMHGDRYPATWAGNVRITR